MLGAFTLQRLLQYFQQISLCLPTKKFENVTYSLVFRKYEFESISSNILWFPKQTHVSYYFTVKECWPVSLYE